MPTADPSRPGADRPTKPVEPAPQPEPGPAPKPEPRKFAAPGDVLRAYRRKMAEPELTVPEPVEPNPRAAGYAVVTRRTRRGHVRAITADGDWTGTLAEAAVLESADAAAVLVAGLGSGVTVAPLARLVDDQLDGQPVLYWQTRE